MNLARWERIVDGPLNVAAVGFLVAYSWRVIGELQGTEEILANTVIFATWLVFLVNYLVSLALTTWRGVWFRSHILELLVVVLPVLRPLRLLRFVKLRMLQRTTGDAIRFKVAVYLVGTILLLVYMSALSMVDHERSVPGANITSVGDGLWWAFVTVTSVGYGDFYPVTGLGRGIAVGLMFCGIALIGVVTATLASWIGERIEKAERPD